MQIEVKREFDVENFTAFCAKYADPFPHYIIDNFLPAQFISSLENDFPVIDNRWDGYLHYNENKYGLNNPSYIPQVFNSAISLFYSDVFCKQLEKITGISGLITDPDLYGAGLHQMRKGGYLNIHTDFTHHPYKSHLKRRLNLILFLNNDWCTEYKGNLEFWDTDMKRCVKEIEPISNRIVVFETTNSTYHGSPNPLTCPPMHTRKSLALYYYTVSDTMNHVATFYKPRPQDDNKKIWFTIDNILLAIYHTYFLKNTYLKNMSGAIFTVLRWAKNFSRHR